MTPLGHHLRETDIVIILQSRNFEEELEQIMERRDSQLEEQFRCIASTQQMNSPPLGECKKLFLEISGIAEG